MKKFFGYVLVLIAGLAGWLYYSDFFAIDACLDRGGCWRYKTGICEFEDQQKCDDERRPILL